MTLVQMVYFDIYYKQDIDRKLTKGIWSLGQIKGKMPHFGQIISQITNGLNQGL
jgi:hypothetical protein